MHRGLSGKKVKFHVYGKGSKKKTRKKKLISIFISDPIKWKIKNLYFRLAALHCGTKKTCRYIFPIFKSENI